MEGSVLSFLKAEWKVSDTGSADWASSYTSNNIKKSLNRSETAKFFFKTQLLKPLGQGKICLFVFLMVFNATFNNI